MKNMFWNYENIQGQPNNLVYAYKNEVCDTKLDPVDKSKPYEEYNYKGELIGYSWHYGETINLEFNISGEVVVEKSSLVLTLSGEIPSPVSGFLGQRAYNVVDFRSWTCTGILDGNRIWTEDEVFTYDDSGERSVYVSAESYMKDKFVELIIYNFRMEPICKTVYEGSSKVIFSIDSKKSLDFKKGIYYCSLSVFNDTIKIPVFSSTDCKLLVK